MDGVNAEPGPGSAARTRGKRGAAELQAGAAAAAGPAAEGALVTGDIGALLTALSQLQQGQALTVAPVPLVVSSSSHGEGGTAPAERSPSGKRPRRAAARGALAVLQAEHEQAVGTADSQMPSLQLPDNMNGRLFRFSVAEQPAAAAAGQLVPSLAPLPQVLTMTVPAAAAAAVAGSEKPEALLPAQLLPPLQRPLPLLKDQQQQQQQQQDVQQPPAVAQQQQSEHAVAKPAMHLGPFAGSAGDAAAELAAVAADTPSDAAEHTLGIQVQLACSPPTRTIASSRGGSSSGTEELVGGGAVPNAAAKLQGSPGAADNQHQGGSSREAAAAVAAAAAEAAAAKEGHGEVGATAQVPASGAGAGGMGAGEEEPPGSPTASEAALLNELMQQRGSSTIVDYQPEIAMAFAALPDAGGSGAAGASAGAAAAAAVGMGSEQDASAAAEDAAAVAAAAARDVEAEVVMIEPSAAAPGRKARGTGGSGSGRVGKRKGGMPSVCPGCGEPPLSEEDKQAASKRGRRRKNDESDPRNRKAELTKEFLEQHLLTARLSLRDICFYHGHCATTVSRVARNLGMDLPASRSERKIGSSSQLLQELSLHRLSQEQDQGQQQGQQQWDVSSLGGTEVTVTCLGEGASHGGAASVGAAGMLPMELAAAEVAAGAHLGAAQEDLLQFPEVAVVDSTAEQSRTAAREALQALEAAAPQHTGVVALPTVLVAQRQRAADLAAAAMAGAALRAAEGAPMLAAAMDLVAGWQGAAVAVESHEARGGGQAAGGLVTAAMAAAAARLFPAGGHTTVEVQVGQPTAAAAADLHAALQ